MGELYVSTGNRESGFRRAKGSAGAIARETHEVNR
jgi:hypothetical protein